MQTPTPQAQVDHPWEDVALVVAHPAHAIMVAGMVQRYLPRILILGKSPVQESIVRQGMAALGMKTQATFLDFSDSESYERVHSEDYVFHVALRDRIHDWLLETRPRIVLGDAFELSNFQHDAGRLLLDSALAKYREQCPDVQNYEFPICCRTDEGTENVLYQTFPFGSYETFHLSPSETGAKRLLADWASSQDGFVAKVCKLISDIQREPYRAVPSDRDYTVLPTGLRRHYDERGFEEVRAGRYVAPILFEKHFIPLVNALRKRDHGT